MTLIPTQVTFRGIAHSDALEADIRRHVEKLERFAREIVGCRVLVDVPHRHRHDGPQFHVRIELTSPGLAPIVVVHQAEPPTDAYLTVHQAFDAARRQLQEATRVQRQVVKVRAASAAR